MITSNGTKLRIFKTYHDGDGSYVGVEASDSDGKTSFYPLDDIEATGGSPEIYATMIDLPGEERSVSE